MVYIQYDIEAVSFAALMGGAWITLNITLAKVCLSYVIFDKNGITFRDSLFKKKQRFSYDDFPVVKFAFYIHMVSPRHFLVFTNVPISEYVLCNVNSVRVCSDFIKINMSSKRYRKLLEILPPEQKEKMEKALHPKYGWKIGKALIQKQYDEADKKRLDERRKHKNKRKMSKKKHHKKR